MATRLLGVSLNVKNLSRSRDFYGRALGFAPAPKTFSWAAPGADSRMRLALGAQSIELVESAGAPMPADSTAADLWFQHFAIVVDDIARAAATVERLGATPISRGGPQRLPKASGGVSAYKFRDPDGHPLELLHFPDRDNSPAVDHSAISVADAARSLAFYQAFGLELQSRQTNKGLEQDRLDGLSGVAVDVIGLFPKVAPPHLELLCYHNPRGRPRRDRDFGAIDDSRLVFEVDDLGATLEKLGGSTLSQDSAATMRDPDGHAIVILRSR